MKYFNIFFLILILSKNSNSNVIGTDMQNFNPTTSGINFVTVQSSETLERGIINFGFFLNYAINSLPYYVDEQTQSRIKFNDTLLMADINFGIGILKNWEVGLSLPHLIRQRVDDDRFHLRFENTGILETRINTKYKFFTHKKHGAAAILSVNFNRIANNPYTGLDASPTYNFELAYDTSYWDFDFAVNLGYRKRNSGEPIPSSVTSTVIIEPFKDQLIASFATSYFLKGYDTKIIGEFFSSFPARKVSYQSNRSQSSAELLLGIKHDLKRYLAIHAGGGTKIKHGNASPDWRLYTGINYSFGPVFSKPDSYRTASDKIDNEENFILEGVLFEFNSELLKPSTKEALDNLVKYLRTLKSYRLVVIEGHTDSIGNPDYNMTLSKRRAVIVKEYLVDVHNIESGKLKTIGYGITRPIANNSNYQGRQKNRRVQFKILFK